MKTYYLDPDFRVWFDDSEGRIPWEDTQGFFNNKCRAFIEGFRVIPEGMEWTASDGTRYTGLMIAAAVDFSKLDEAQREYERQEMADMQEALAMLEVRLNG